MGFSIVSERVRDSFRCGKLKKLKKLGKRLDDTQHLYYNYIGLHGRSKGDFMLHFVLYSTEKCEHLRWKVTWQEK